MHPQILQCIAACLVATSVAIYAATRRERDDVRWPVIGFGIVIVLWTGGMGFRRWMVDSEPDNLVYFIHYIGAVGISPMWAILAARMTRSKWLAQRRLALVVIPSCFAWAALVTNPLHHLYLIAGIPRLDEPLVNSAGPLLWGFTAWSYLLVMFGVGLFIHFAATLYRSGERLRGMALGAAALLPLISGMLSTLGVTPVGYNLTPLAIAISVSALFALHWQHRMRETLPLARRDVIEHLADGVIVLDEGGLILDANPAAESLLGLDLEVLQKGTIREAIASSNTRIDRQEFEQASSMMNNSSGPWVYTLRTRDDRIIESTVERVKSRGRGAAGYFIVLRDLTERRRLETFLHQSQRLETVAALSAGIAHEVNNPLAFMRSNLHHIQKLGAELEARFAELSDETLEQFDELQSVVAECEEGAERISNLVDRVRRFSHLQADELRPIQMRNVIEDAIKIAQLQQVSILSLHTQIESELPPVRASHEHLVQLVLNLLVNAQQATIECQEPRIDVSTEVEDGQVLVRVSDNGSGIPPEIRSRIFDPFFTTKATGEGTGLGLSIAFGIAREHGGALEFDSREGGGTEFYLSLPIDNGGVHDLP